MKRFSTLATASALTAMAAAAAPVTPDQAETLLVEYGATDIDVQAAKPGTVTIAATLDSGYDIILRLGGCEEVDGCGYALFFVNFTPESTSTDDMIYKTIMYNDSFPFGRAFAIFDEAEEQTSVTAVGVDYTLDLTEETTLDAGDIATFETIIETYIGYWTSN